MNMINESNQLTSVNEGKFLENTMLNLLAANQFGSLVAYAIEKAGAKIKESQIVSSLLSDEDKKKEH